MMSLMVPSCGCKPSLPNSLHKPFLRQTRARQWTVNCNVGVGKPLGWVHWCGGRSVELVGFHMSVKSSMRGVQRFKVAAELRGKGKRLLARDIRVKRIMGEGSFGQVFEGLLADPSGERNVVLKRVKTRVKGAQEMVEMEHLLSVYASRVAKDSVAEFLGFCGVSDKEASGGLSEGLWLVWQYEGYKTLQYYLQRRDCIASLAMDMGISEQAVAPTVMKQIFEALQGLHSAGLVHRDVKPSNLLFVEATKHFKLIDLGACADLRSGTNYVPDESIFDPIYRPPEDYVLPTDCPKLGGNMFSGVMSPLLWAQHLPDRFDMFSAGLIMMQLSVPTMHRSSAIKSFRTQLESHDFDLQRWRKSAINLRPAHQKVLDDENGAGWKLVEQLLRPRRIERDDDGGVRFIQKGSVPRISASESLKHKFVKMAMEPLVDSKPSFSLWQSFSRKLMDLESKILKQTIATETQTTKVKKIRKDFARGKASKGALEKEEKALSKMETDLEGLADQFEDTTEKAFDVFGIVRGVGEAFETWRDKSLAFRWLKPETASKKPSEVSCNDNTRSKVTKEPAISSATDNLVYIGKKFTGLAAKIAADLAVALKDDMANVLSGVESLAVEQRKQARAERDFMAMLKSIEPPIESSTQYVYVEKNVGTDPRFLAISSESSRERIFNKYIASIRRKEEKAMRIARAELKAMYVEMDVGPTSSWKKISLQLRGTSVFEAVVDKEEQKAAFDEVVEDCKARKEKEKAQETMQAEFRELLKGLDITSSTTWPSVKRNLFSKAQFQAISESRRRAIFKEYLEIIIEEEREKEEKTAADLKQKERRQPTKTSDASSDATAGDKEARIESAALKLRELKDQQAKLKEEYRKMEEKLKAMQSKMDTSLEQDEEQESVDGVPQNGNGGTDDEASVVHLSR